MKIKTFVLFLTPYDRTHKTKSRIILKALLFYLIFTLLAIIIRLLLSEILPAEISEVHYQTLTHKVTHNQSPSPLFLLTLFIWLPLREELGFRLWCSLKKWHCIVSSIFFTYLLSISLLYVFHIEIMTCIHIIVLIISLSCGLCFSFFVKQKYLDSIKCNLKLVACLILIVNAIFASFHLQNYVITPMNFFAGLIACLPQFVGGITFSYLRINLGFYYALLLHIISNIIVYLL